MHLCWWPPPKLLRVELTACVLARAGADACAGACAGAGAGPVFELRRTCLCPALHAWCAACVLSCVGFLFFSIRLCLLLLSAECVEDGKAARRSHHVVVVAAAAAAAAVAVAVAAHTTVASLPSVNMPTPMHSSRHN